MGKPMKHSSPLPATTQDLGNSICIYFGKKQCLPLPKEFKSFSLGVWTSVHTQSVDCFHQGFQSRSKWGKHRSISSYVGWAGMFYPDYFCLKINVVCPASWVFGAAPVSSYFPGLILGSLISSVSLCCLLINSLFRRSWFQSYVNFDLRQTIWEALPHTRWWRPELRHW